MSTPKQPAQRNVILALDQGTHASRALLFDSRGNALCAFKQTVKLLRSGLDRVEQDPDEILDSLQQVIDQARKYAQVHGLNIKTAGLCTQRSTVVAWDKTSADPLYPALSWQDTRGKQYLDDLKIDHSEIRSRSGLQLSAHYGASKLRWLVENVSAIRTAAKEGKLCIGPLASFLLSHLLEERGFVIDHANAARTLLWNIQECDWDTKLLKAFSIESQWLPRSLPIRTEYGRLRNTEIPINAVNGDQGAALYGHGALQPDTAVVNVGTGAFILMHTDSTAVMHPRLLSGITDSNRKRLQYALEGTVNGAGAALQWVQHNWGLNQSDSFTPVGIEDPPLFINTVGGLGSPWWKTGPAPTLIGLKSKDCENKPGFCLVAILESIVFMIQANLEQMLNSGMTIRRLSIGGGLSRYDLLCQSLADLSLLPVIRSDLSENTARGIAWLAANEPDSFPALSGQWFSPRSNPGLQRRFQHYISIVDNL